MGLALRCEAEFLQPVFDRKRFDLAERTLTPLWLYVILEPGIDSETRSSFFLEALARDNLRSLRRTVQGFPRVSQC